MAITSAALKSQCFLQQVIPPPYHTNANEKKLSISHLYSQKPYKLYRILAKSLIFLWNLPCVVVQLMLYFYNWETNTVKEMKQATFYGVFLCVILAFLPAEHFQQTYYKLLIYLANETFKIVQLEKSDTAHKVKFKVPLFGTYCLNEIYIYGFSACFVVLGPAYLAAPFAISFLPLELIFGGKIWIKLCDGIIHCIAVTYGAFTVLSVNIFALIFLENFIFYTKSCIPEEKYTNLRFIKYFKRFRKFQLLLNLLSVIYSKFLVCLVFVGIFLASGCCCITIRMYGNMNLSTYILFPSLTVICIADAIILTYLANRLRCQKFKPWWKLVLTKREDKKLLKACPPTGFVLGPYGIVTAALGLRICDDYINNTVNVLLLGFL